MEAVFAHSDGRQECHPLFNELIFENIVPYLKVEELKTARLVCKKWLAFTTPTLKQKAWVKFGLYDQFKYFNFLDYLSQVARIDITDNSERRPVFYQNYEFQNSTFALNQVRLNEFVLRCGPFVKSIHFYRVVVHLATFRNILMNSLPELENLSFSTCYFYNSNGPEIKDEVIPSVNRNLKSFIFSNESNDDDSNDNLMPWNWAEFFNCFPCLTELNLLDLNEEMTNKWLLAAQDLEQPLNLNIKKLNVFAQTGYSTGDIPEIHWRLLLRLNLKLTSLQIDIGQFSDEEEFAKLIKQQSNTLKELRIWRGIMADEISVFPFEISLPKLKILEISENCLQNMEFLNHTRNLKDLWIRQCLNEPFDNFTKLLSVNLGKVESLPSLESFRIDAFLLDTDLKNMNILFPKVQNVDYLKPVQVDESNYFSADESDWE